ncbi:MAG: cadherin-like domain-containing protein, partial [Acidobacteria bacterium]|nr:cadherin-like domain-containing protein [Acidobacteriota bacterium]
MSIRRVTTLFAAALCLLLPAALRAGNCDPTLRLTNDTVATEPGVPILVDVLANDSSGCGAPMTVNAPTENCLGTLIDNGDGTLLYMPTATEDARCDFSYTVTDEDGGTGTATVTIYVGNGGGPASPVGLPTVDPRDPHRFFADGQALHLAGYYPGIQALLVAAPGAGLRGQHEALFDALASHHINLLRLVLTMGMAMEEHNWIHPYQRSATCCTYHSTHEPGVPQGNKFNLSLWNEEFFSYWESVAQAAQERGIYLQFSLLDGFHSKTDDQSGHDDDPAWVPLDRWGYKYSYFSSENSVGIPDLISTSQLYKRTDLVQKQAALVREAVSRLCHFDNILWETINEPQDSDADHPLADFGGRSFQQVIRDEINTAESTAGCSPHLVVPFDSPDHRDLGGHWLPSGGARPDEPGMADDPNVDDDDLEYRFSYERLVNDFENDFPSDPLIADNDCCASPGTPAQLRKKAWLSLVAGANPSMLVYTVPHAGVGIQSPVVQDGMRFVGYTKKLIDDLGVDLVGMVPRSDLITQAPSDFVWLLARQGEEYIAYLYQGGQITFQPGALPASYEAFWFDPMTGQQQPATPSGSSFVATGALVDEAVLYVRSTGVGAPQITITQQPQSDSAPIGSEVSFLVSATSDPPLPLSFEWLRDGAALPADGRHFVVTNGGTSTLTLDPVLAGDDQAQFTCTVSAEGATPKTSQAAFLTVTQGTSPLVVDDFEL